MAITSQEFDQGAAVSLWSEFLNHKDWPIHKWQHYFTTHERHFACYVNRPLTFVEIGCGLGGSLQMWKKYFGPEAQIVCLDINGGCKTYEGNIAVRIGDQPDTAFLATLLKEFGTPDIVLDDGSHMMSHIVATFSYQFPRMAPDGVYMIEDLHTAYCAEYQGGLRRPGSFIELCKELVDELNTGWGGRALAPTEFSRTTHSMHFYDSIVTSERGRTFGKRAPMIPPPEA